MPNLNSQINRFRFGAILFAILQASNSWANCIGSTSKIEKCALSGDATSQSLLGDIYFYGNEAPKNYKESFKWHTLAAKQGLKASQSSLGFAYYNGWGVEKDMVMAYAWWSLGSIGQNQPIDKENLQNLERSLTANEIERAQEIAKRCLDTNFQSCR